ncbi:hypothetical protein GlitD10_1298 [Gloeomargarita lithophora Alchichica-D10]|uniref:DUF29 domain-containing protein n=1 Tax=Gloeomargarita lithophora Alchichica-D10 TaxID=1188229 RepID=A0A1J0ACH5_9CYAN|nr:DUF29 domain-containing protein [Gloeomargarita lithophora]APB33619.1 hypothetical protein GlitD10_1298 [Gloeomargarita lithophora Alchichica-D10]
MEPQATTDYDRDFYAWTQTQVAYLRTEQFHLLDIDHLCEEIASLGKQQKRELRHRLGILLGHLLKWTYQPSARSKSWQATIQEQRERIQEHLEENPSLQPYLAEAIQKGYRDGLNLVNRETPLDPAQLPPSCPFSKAQIFAEPIAISDCHVSPIIFNKP